MESKNKNFYKYLSNFVKLLRDFQKNYYNNTIEIKSIREKIDLDILYFCDCLKNKENFNENDKIIKIFNIIINSMKFKNNIKLIIECLNLIEIIITNNLIKEKIINMKIDNLFINFFEIHKNYNKSNNNVIIKSLNLITNICHSKYLNFTNKNLYNAINYILYIYLNYENNKKNSENEINNIIEKTISEIMSVFIEKFDKYITLNKNLNEIMKKNINKKIKKYYCLIFIENDEKNYFKLLTKYYLDKVDNYKHLNEKGIEAGKFGFCIYCREQANFKSDYDNLPICSKECNNKFILLEQMINNEIIYSSDNYLIFEDIINILKIFCIVLNYYSFYEITPKNENKFINLLNYIILLLNKISEFLEYAQNDIIFIIKKLIMPLIIKLSLNCLNIENFNIFNKILNLFNLIMGNQKFCLIKNEIFLEIFLFFDKIIFKNFLNEKKNYKLLNIIIDFFINNIYIIFEIFTNFDCNEYFQNYFNFLIEFFTKFIYIIYDVKLLKNNTIKENENEDESQFKLKCLDFMTNLLNNIQSFILENKKDFNFNTKNINDNILLKNISSISIDKLNINPTLCIKYLIEQKILYNINEFNNFKENYNKTIKTNFKNEINFKNNYFFYFSLKSDYHYKLLNNFFSDYYNDNNNKNSTNENISYDDYTAYFLSLFIRFNLQNKYNSIIDKNKISLFFSSNETYNIKVLTFYINSLNFKNYLLLESINLLFDCLPIILNEYNIIERTLKIFIKKYIKDNNININYFEYFYRITFMILEISNDLINKKNNIKTIGEYINKINEFFPIFMNEKKEYFISINYICDIYNKVLENPIDFNKNLNDINDKKIDKNNLLYNYNIDYLNLNKSEIFCGLNYKNYKNEITLDDIKNLLEKSWSNFLGIFSKMLQIYTDGFLIKQSIENILLIGKICNFFKLYVISDAFFNTIINQSSLLNENKNIILNDKNILCLKIFFNFIEKNGNFIYSSWTNIINLIIKIEDIQNNIEIYNFPKKINDDLNLFNFENIFDLTQKYDIEILNEFFKSLCIISKNCLLKDINVNSNNEKDFISKNKFYTLHKIAQILECNINRPQNEIEIIYKTISDFYFDIILSSKNDLINNIILDNLRQISIQILTRKNNNYNNNFELKILLPFEIIFNKNLKNINFLENIFDCLINIIEICKNIKSGFFVIFNIIKSCLNNKINKVYQKILKILEIKENEIENYIIEILNNYKNFFEDMCQMYEIIEFKDFIEQKFIKIFKFICSKTDISENKRIEILENFCYNLDNINNNSDAFEYLNLLYKIFNECKNEILKNKDNFIIIYYCFIKLNFNILIFGKFMNIIIIKNNNLNLNNIIEKEILEFLNEDNFDDNIYKIIINIMKKNIENLFKDLPNDNILGIIINNYNKDLNTKDFISKKLNYIKNLTMVKYEKIFDQIFQKYYEFLINLNDKKYIYYLFDVLILLLNYSFFNSFSQILFKNINIYFLKFGNDFDKNQWEKIILNIKNILNLLTIICDIENEKNKKDLTNYLYYFLSFILNIITLFFDKFKEQINISIFFEQLSIINIFLIKIESNKNKINKLSKNIDIIKLITQIKILILEKNKNFKDLYDKNFLINLKNLSLLINKYNKENEEINSLLEIFEIYFNNFLIKFIVFLSKEELEIVFNLLIDMLQLNNKKIREISINLIKNYFNLNLCSFQTYNET